MATIHQTSQKKSTSKVLNLSTHDILSQFSTIDPDYIDLDKENQLSPSDVKRLFFIWFNSISNDNTSVTLSQFSSILNRIFTSSISQSELSQMFHNVQTFHNENNIAYYHEFLSPTNNTFTDTIIPLLQNNETAQSTLQSVPNECINNPSNNTLQQILHDQSQQITALKQWIIDIGLPAHSKTATLNRALSDLDLELHLVEEEKNDLKSDQDVMNKSYSMLKDNFTYSVQQINDLKALNVEHKIFNVKLKVSLDAVKEEVIIERQKNKESKETIDKLSKLNNQYQETNEQLTIKNEHQSKEITKISNAKQQLDTTMERAFIALQQQTEQINTLQNQLQLFQSKQQMHRPYHSGSGHEATNMIAGMRYNTPRFAQSNSNARRDSYAFSMRTQMGLYDDTISASDADEMKRRDTIDKLPHLPSTFIFNQHTDVFTKEEKNQSFIMNGYDDDNTLRIGSHSSNNTLLEYQYKDLMDKEESNETETEKMPLVDQIDKRSADIIRRREEKGDTLPRGFEEATQNQCVLFGWKLW